MEAKMQAFEDLMAEVSGALADIVVSLQEGKSGTDEICATLVDLAQVIGSKSKDGSMDSIAQAIKSIRIDSPVTVNVSPTPITVTPTVQIIERSGDYKLTVKYDNHDRITEAFISRASKETQ